MVIWFVVIWDNAKARDHNKQIKRGIKLTTLYKSDDF